MKSVDSRVAARKKKNKLSLILIISINDLNVPISLQLRNRKLYQLYEDELCLSEGWG
jgi:hypothetical protein